MTISSPFSSAAGREETVRVNEVNSEIIVSILTTGKQLMLLKMAPA
jgi:hypothetical protein